MAQLIRPEYSRHTTAPTNQAMVEAARSASSRDLGVLSKAGGDLNGSWRHYRPIHAVIQPTPHERTESDSKRLTCLRWLAARGADLESLGGWPAVRPVLLAAFSGVPAYVEELRRAGARADGFLFAAMGDHARVARILRDDPDFATARDTSGLTALHCCAASHMQEGDRTAVAQLLLEYGADAKARACSWGHELDPVKLAVPTCNRAIFELLLKHGADATAALSPALWRSCTELAEIAVQHGAAIDEARDEGRPVLNQMVRWNRVKHARWLLSNGASPNLADERGWTALHQAASVGSEEMVSALIQAGADMLRAAKDGRLPVDVAKASRREAAAQLLIPR